MDAAILCTPPVRLRGVDKGNFSFSEVWT